MKIVLSPEEKQFLELKHSKEKDHRKADRIKSVLLRSEGWSLSKIAQALRLHNDTVSGYVSDYLNHNNLDFNYKLKLRTFILTNYFHRIFHFYKFPMTSLISGY